MFGCAGFVAVRALSLAVAGGGATPLGVVRRLLFVAERSLRAPQACIVAARELSKVPWAPEHKPDSVVIQA